MALDTYANLKSSIIAWLHRLNETSLDMRVDEFITLTEDKLNLELSILAMETSIPLTDITDRTVDLPEDYRGIRRIYVDGNPSHKMDYMSPETFWGTWLSVEQGLPKAYTIEGGGTFDYTISFGPHPDGRTFQLLYWRKFPRLSDANPTNWYLNNAAGLLLYGSLLQASLHFTKPSEEALRWATVYDDLIEQVKTADRRMKYPAISPQSRDAGITPI